MPTKTASLPKPAPPNKQTVNGSHKAAGAALSPETEPLSAAKEATFDVFRRWGYLQTTLDPLGQYLPPEPFPSALPQGSDDAAAEARGYYCGTIGSESLHIANAEKREWRQAQMEREARPVNQAKVLTELIKADLY